MLQDRFTELKPLLEIHGRTRVKRDECLTNLGKVSDVKTRSDLFKIFETVKLKFNLLDNEFIECRKRLKITPKYYYYEQEFEEVINTFNQYLVLALLSQ
jgi:hypothetical protein